MITGDVLVFILFVILAMLVVLFLGWGTYAVVAYRRHTKHEMKLDKHSTDLVVIDSKMDHVIKRVDDMHSVLFQK